MMAVNYNAVYAAAAAFLRIVVQSQSMEQDILCGGNAEFNE